jgi:predicted N-formylglutamate amidohydrolase
VKHKKQARFILKELCRMPFPPYHLVDGDQARGLVLLADHARRDLPEEYGSLGLPPAEFERHIAYDIGVEHLTRKLAAMLGVPAVLGGFSRLLIDPNRGEDDPTLIMRLSDGAIIPGNNPMPSGEREKRLNEYYRPYHRAISKTIEAVTEASGKAPLIISIHSFTAFWKTTPRPWHAGILWDKDPRAVKPLLAGLRADRQLIVGDNEPYDGALRNDTMFQHCIVPGLAHALIEVRQDLIAEGAGIAHWADRLAPILEAINANPDMHVARQFGSRTGPIEEVLR